MEEQFVTYEIALKLKELGFDEECFGYWRDENKPCPITMCKFTTKYDFDDDINFPKFKCLAPLWQQVIDWLRDEHDIVIEIARQKYFDTYANSYAYEAVCKVYKNKELEGSVVIRDNKNNHIFYSYEEAREQAILKAIELCQR